MKITLKFLSFLLILFIFISCTEDVKKTPKHFWVRVQILKELGYENITLNGNLEDPNLEDEYIKDKGSDYNGWKNALESNKTFYNIFFIKLPIKTSMEDLKDYKIEIKSKEKIVWRGVLYNEDAFSPCGFYQMKDEEYKDKIKEIMFNFIETSDNYLKLENRYYISPNESMLCDYHKNDKPKKVMIAVNIANNSFNSNLIETINELEVDNGIKNNYIWYNYQDLIEKSSLSLYKYSENQDGYGKNSGYWNLMLDRDKLKDYKLNFLSKDGIKTTINLDEIQFCGTKEKTYEDLIDDFGVLTYGFTLKDGVPRLDFRGALNNQNRFVNCSKGSDTSQFAFSPDKLLNDRYGDIKITKFNNEDYDYSFSDNKVLISYDNLVTNPTEYKESGLNRWILSIYIHYTQSTKDGFVFFIPWHLIKEGELKINSSMIDEQVENEKSYWSYIFKPIFYNEEHPIEFNLGRPIINYGDYQEITYKFNKVPKFYGDFLDMEFHFIAKEGEDTLIDYAGTINSQYFGEDIFHCFNSDNLWICPKPGYEENFPWMEN